MQSLNERITLLENQIIQLTGTIGYLNNIISKLNPSITTVIGLGVEPKDIKGIDIKTGRAGITGAGTIWNDSEIGNPPINEEPELPKIGYNKHTHTRYSGGALVFDGLEIVDYDFTKDSQGNTVSPISNIHSQQFWQYKPAIKKVQNSKGEAVEKIGAVDFTFNPDSRKWGVAATEIDISKCLLVARNDKGEIIKDSKGQEMKSPLYNALSSKTSVTWDENARCFRFFAVFAPDLSGIENDVNTIENLVKGLGSI